MAHKHFTRAGKLFPMRARMSNSETTQPGPGIGQLNTNGWQRVEARLLSVGGSSQVSKGRRRRMMKCGKMLMQG